jgi:formylglycine-generating enzyme required for sulfatase activity
MGDGESYCGEQEHEVTLTRDFYLGPQEVTNREYLEALQWALDQGHVTVTSNVVLDNMDDSQALLMLLDDAAGEIQFDGAGSFYLRESPSSHAQAAYPAGYDPATHPVIWVTWYGAARYCDWRSLMEGLPRAYEHDGDWSCNGGMPYEASGYRLPTDAEREYAAQWNDERRYPWGSEAANCSLANFYSSDYCVGWTAPVGSYPDAPVALGLADMPGNVWEWCNDWWQCDLGTAPVTDPAGPASGDYRVLRGGGWYYGAHNLRCAQRSSGNADGCFHHIGFRVARIIDPQDVGRSDVNRPSFLATNDPNPFTERTRIRYHLPSAGAAVVNIYDPTGRIIRTLRADAHGAGAHAVTWDGRNQGGQQVPAGLYLYELRWNGRRESRRMLLVR